MEQKAMKNSSTETNRAAIGAFSLRPDVTETRLHSPPVVASTRTGKPNEAKSSFRP